jgi:hypothetical protein
LETNARETEQHSSKLGFQYSLQRSNVRHTNPFDERKGERYDVLKVGDVCR